MNCQESARVKLSLKECERLTKRVYKAYGKPSPRVADGRGHRRWTIQLPKWARTGAVVLHECAHGLQEHFAPRCADHGPEFVAIFAELLNMIYGCSVYWLEGEALKFRVNMAAASYKPEHLKARIKHATTQRSSIR